MVSTSGKLFILSSLIDLVIIEHYEYYVVHLGVQFLQCRNIFNHKFLIYFHNGEKAVYCHQVGMFSVCQHITESARQ